MGVYQTRFLDCLGTIIIGFGLAWSVQLNAAYAGRRSFTWLIWTSTT